MKILILTGKFGMGHYSAAMALSRQISSSDPDVVAEVVDLFEFAVPGCYEELYKAFGVMVTRGSFLYNRFYNAMEKRGPDIRPVFLSYFLKQLQRLIRKAEPDAVFSTFPFCSQLVSRYKKKTGDTLPLITCITDISSHCEWINRFTDCYLVPSETVCERLIGKGVDTRRIYVYGIPVRPEFDGPDKPVRDGRKHILIMGGGLGLLPDNMEFYEELSRCPSVRITVIAGKNAEIYGQLSGTYENIRVIGYTNEVHKYMKEADVVISKPGGITLFETIHSETPLLVFKPFLQQEINNSSFITQNGIGRILEKNQEICLKEILRVVNDDVLLAAMRKNVVHLKKEYEEKNIDAIFSYISLNEKEAYA